MSLNVPVLYLFYFWPKLNIEKEKNTEITQTHTQKYSNDEIND